MNMNTGSDEQLKQSGSSWGRSGAHGVFFGGAKACAVAAGAHTKFGDGY